MTTKSIALRDSRDRLGSRYLGASLSADGTLTISGQDLGDGVEQILGPGIREYEWEWTIRSEHVALLASALDSGPDVLVALAQRFANEAAVGLQPFLDKHGIPYDGWYRMGE
jgi:hypothetical protein